MIRLWTTPETGMTLDVDADRGQLTRLLRAWSGGDARAADAVLALVYDRIRQLAARRLRAEGGGHGLQPTELANELVINLLDADVAWQDRVHFFKTVAVALRNILHDVGRRQGSAKRGGGQIRVTLGAAEDVPAEDVSDAEALHEALLQLRASDARKADVVELNYLVGLELEDVARVLDVSLATVNRDLRFARAWLRERLAA
jgi:RNA polymerase sigma factor (TIGR02999 family)